MERFVKSGWHALLAVASIVEWRMSRTLFRRNLCLACAGWHIAAAVDDWKKPSEYDRVRPYQQEI